MDSAHPPLLPFREMPEESPPRPDGTPRDRLIARFYDQLRAIAARKLADERAGNSHHVTSLTHEAVLRIMAAPEGRSWERPGYFFAAAAEAMRRILVEAARRRRALKYRPVGDLTPIDGLPIAAHDVAQEVIVVNDMLSALAERDGMAADVVRLRYFGGMTLAEIAAALGIPERTVDRRWAYARAWLGRQLRRVEHVPPVFPGGKV